MAAFTIQDLKNELINHGVELPPSSARKEDYILLYEENIAKGEKAKFDFSSDDEEVAFSVGKKVSKKRVSRKSEGVNSTTKKTEEIPGQGTLTEANSLVVGDVDVAELTDAQLADKLKEYNVEVGPIVGRS